MVSNEKFLPASNRNDVPLDKDKAQQKEKERY